jgi:hypothetical protein
MKGTCESPFFFVYLQGNNKKINIMKIYFQNKSKENVGFEKQVVDIDNEPNIQDYLEKAKLTDYIIPIAEITSSDKKCGYYVEVYNSYKDHNQWVYILTIQDKIIKIGDSTMTLSGRWNSYSAGTRSAREKGTCSTTNYYISEIIRVALNMKLEVKLYGYPIPNRIYDIDVFGDKESALADFVKLYEGKMIERFNNIYGKLPVVGKNGKGNSKNLI